jgi:hypothetical protein
MSAIQSLAFVVRSLWRRPGYVAVVIATLALGIGGSCTIFSFINGVLLRPLDYPMSARLAIVGETNLQPASD